MSVSEINRTELAILNNGSYDSIGSVDSLLIDSKFDYSFLLALIKEVTIKNDDVLDKIIDISNSINNQIINTQDRVSNIKRSITDIYFDLRNTQAIDKNIPTYIKQVVFDFNQRDFFTEDSSVMFKEGKILGINTNPNISSDHDNQTLDIYSLNKITVLLTDSFGVYDGYISHTRINKNLPFFIQAISPTFIKQRKFELILDRPNRSEINQIDISLKEAHIIEVQASDDNIDFQPVYNQKTYIKESVITFSSIRSRYIKLVFYKNSQLNSVLRNGEYYYRIDFNYLFIAGLSINNDSEFITKSIDPQIASLSGVAIDTCDNYQDPDVDIAYFIDFNNENDWKEIKPIGKIKESKKQIRSYIRVNDYYDNKIIKIPRDLGIKVDNILEYQVSIEDEFLDTNQIKLFTDRLDENNTSWKLEDDFYTAWIILNDAKNIVLNNSYTIYLNDIPYLGTSAGQNFRIDAGIYKVKIPQAAYHYIFNPVVFDIRSVSSIGDYNLQNKNTKALTNISDIYYPFNIKLNIELIADFIFSTQLIEPTDFSIYNSRIRTKIHKDLYLVYRLLEEDASGFTLRIKGIYKSLNKLTIPFTDRFNLRLI